jgi:hypothetical protein
MSPSTKYHSYQKGNCVSVTQSAINSKLRIAHEAHNVQPTLSQRTKKTTKAKLYESTKMSPSERIFCISNINAFLFNSPYTSADGIILSSFFRTETLT